MELSKLHTRGMVVLHTVSLLLVFFAFVAFIKISSTVVAYNKADGSLIGVSGFTNLDNWRMETKTISCNANFEIYNGDLKNINSLKFSTPIQSLTSTHPAMDSIVYHMLSANGAKEISFVQTKQMILPKMKMVNMIGELTIGNETKVVDLQLSYEVINAQQINFKGLKKLDLHEFGVTRSNPILKKIKFEDQIMIQIEMNLINGLNIDRLEKSKVLSIN